MIYTQLTKKAMKIAYDAHHGQVDKGGDPYIFHPIHLAEQMEDELTTCVALLHDVVEDTRVTLEDLQKEFPGEVIEALRLLTHNDATPYLDYVAVIAGNPIARAVKLADLEHNSDETRLAGCAQVSEATRARLREKYAKARAVLDSTAETTTL
ncbi:MAG: HD domain-containing protein [Eggerthellaceae bacterium]|nr:HD domain-containing protein [Eggerthellaceae bacterium]